MKHPKRKIKSYFNIIITRTLLLFLVLVILSLLFSGKVPESILVIWSMYLSFIIVSFIANVIIGYLKNKNKKSIFTIDKDGILDEEDSGMDIKYSWDKIELIVIKDDAIYVLSDFSIILYSDIDDKEKTIEVIKRYNKKSVLVIQ